MLYIINVRAAELSKGHFLVLFPFTSTLFSFTFTRIPFTSARISFTCRFAYHFPICHGVPHPMSMLNTASSWNVGRVAGRCAACGTGLPPNQTCWAALCDGLPPKRPAPAAAPAKPDPKKKEEPAPSPFIRVDFCEACWNQGRRPENLSAEALGIEPGAKLSMFSYWRTTVPEPQQKKKLLVDDSVLVDVFQRMEGKNEPQEIRFRFVLALILMRKRLLKYEGTQEAPPRTDSLAPATPETWIMLPRGTEARVHVINPHLTAEQITEVSQQLSAILAPEV